MNTQKLSYTFADGSGNQYKLSPNVLEYIPVKPEESSTGMYSGGEPKTVNVTTEQFTTLETLFKKAIENSSIHMQDRIKTSGAITVSHENKQKHYIIKPNTKELIAIDSTLRKMVGR